MSQHRRQPCTCECGCTIKTRRAERQPDGPPRFICGSCAQGEHMLQETPAEETAFVVAKVESRAPAMAADPGVPALTREQRRAYLRRHGILPAEDRVIEGEVVEVDDGTAPVVPEPTAPPPKAIPSRTRPRGMIGWRPATLMARLCVTVELYRARWRRRLADGGDRCRENTSSYRHRASWGLA